MQQFLEKLFSSKTRVKLLVHFLQNPEDEFFVRQLTRALGEQINSIRRELTNLESIGLLTSRTEKRKRYYRVNQNHVLFEELTNMIKKTTMQHGDIAVDLERLGQIDLVLLTGSFMDTPEAPVDLLAIGSINKDRMAEYIRMLEKRTMREIRYALLTKEDYLFRRNCQDRFITQVLKSRYHVPVNKLNIQLS